jgi:type II secretory ATPase GspE/PulE/Tfp pilus assembly ATPase PilB-like protein
MDEQPLIQKLIPEELVKKLSVESFYIEARSKRPILRVSEPLDDATEKNLIGLLGEDLCINQITAQSKNPEELINRLLEEAILKKATDIHFDPHRESIIVRIRLDGLLYPIYQLSVSLYQRVLNHVKIRSRLNIAEKRLPQEGGFSHDIAVQHLDVRISIIATCFGEKLAMRILPSGNEFMSLEDIGFPPHLERFMIEKLSRKTGSVLVSGPTGSGKSSTLHVFMKHIDKRKLHVISIEDPVEIFDEGINQLPVTESLGLTYSQLLKRVLRQDPDVILLGEIRDPETAKLTCEASLTGHFVLSTIHAKDGESILLRLMDMGVDPYLVASSVDVLISQRLVRKVCPICSDTITMDPFFQQWSGLSEMKQGKGCDFCYYSGYRYRTGIFEIIQLSSESKRVIAEKDRHHELNHLLKKDRQVSLKQYGIELVRQGVTTIDEVYLNLSS